MIRHTDNDVNPLARIDGVLEVTADATIMLLVEDVETDAIGAILEIGLAVHSECPLLLARGPFREPVDVAGTLGFLKVRGIGPHPGGNRQAAGRGYAERGVVGYFDVRTLSVEDQSTGHGSPRLEWELLPRAGAELGIRGSATITEKCVTPLPSTRRYTSGKTTDAIATVSSSRGSSWNFSHGPTPN